MHEKAIIIGKLWAGLFLTLVAAFLIGGFGYAWNANSQGAVTQEKISGLEKNQTVITEAKLPERMVAVEQVVKSSNEKIDGVKLDVRDVKDDVKGMKDDIGRKLDMIVQNQMQIQMNPQRVSPAR